MKVFVVLFWYWDADDCLTNTFVDVKRSLGKAKSAIKKHKKTSNPRVYLPDEPIPYEEEGNYYQDGFYQIIEKGI